MEEKISKFNHGDLYDFCKDWCGNKISKKTLCKRFVVLHKWKFSDFTWETRELGLWVDSMYALRFAEDFAA